MRTVLLLLAVVAAASAVQFTGVSESGYEQDGYPSTWNVQPHNASILYFKGQGVNLIRLPFRWERALTNGLGSALNTNSGGYFQLYLSTVAYALSQGMTVLVDMHNYARFPLPNGNSFTQGNTGWNLMIGKGTSQAGYSDFQNVWNQIASIPLLNSNSQVWFGLMNEPAGYNFANGTYSSNSDSFVPGDAVELANAGIAGVRAAGANNLVLVAGTVWTGVHSFLDRTWYSPHSGPGNYQSNADALGSGIEDSQNNWAIEVHTYLDSGFAGNPSNPCNTYPSNIFPALTNWAQGQAVNYPAYGWNPAATCPNSVQAGCNQYPAVSGRNIRLFLGEFGFQNNQQCINAGSTVLNFIQQNSVDNGGPWLGFSWWAGGPNWGSGSTYGYNVEPEWDPSSSNGWCNPDTTQCSPTYNPLASVVKSWWVGGTGNAGSTSTGGSSSTSGSSTSGSSTSGSSTSGSSTSGSSTSGSSTSGSSSTGSSGSCASPAAAAGAQCGNSAGYPLSQGSNPPSSFSCCPSGYSCQWVNNYWWQCNAVSSSSSSSGSSTSGSSTSGSSTSGSSTSGSSSSSSTSGGSGGACIADWQQCGTNAPFDGSYASSASAGCCTQPGYQGTGVYKGCSQPGGTGYWQCKPS